MYFFLVKKNIYTSNLLCLVGKVKKKKIKERQRAVNRRVRKIVAKNTEYLVMDSALTKLINRKSGFILRTLVTTKKMKRIMKLMKTMRMRKWMKSQ